MLNRVAQRVEKNAESGEEPQGRHSRVRAWKSGMWLALAMVLVLATGPATGEERAANDPFEAFLYFADPASPHLRAVSASFPPGMEAHDLGMAVLKALMAGPPASGVERIFPEKTRVNALFITPEGNAYVDLGLEEAAFEDTMGEYLGVYSLVNTLAVNIPEIKQVKILVNGSDSGALGSHLSLEPFFTTNMRIVK